MRANLTAPALATWLCVGGIICIVWHVPWYVGVLAGLAAAITAYLALLAMEPKWRLLPSWPGFGALAIAQAAMAFWAYPQMEFLAGIFAAAAFVNLSDCLRAFTSPSQAKTPEA